MCAGVVVEWRGCGVGVVRCGFRFGAVVRVQRLRMRIVHAVETKEGQQGNGESQWGIR